ncbi:hypothetical protein ACFQ1B_33235 [Streptomyces mexicanus]
MRSSLPPIAHHHNDGPAPPGAHGLPERRRRPSAGPGPGGRAAAAD